VIHSIHAKDQVQWGAKFGSAWRSCQKSNIYNWAFLESKKTQEEWTIFESIFVGLLPITTKALKDIVLRFIIEL